MKKIFAIVFGDPVSINNEIISKIWKNSKTYNKKYIIIGNFDIFKFQLKKNKIRIKINRIQDTNFKYLDFTKLNILDVPVSIKNFKQLNKYQIQKLVKNSLVLAHSLAEKKIISGFINCAINKRILGLNNQGVTEYLAKLNGVYGKESMLLYGDKFSVSPITTHIPLRKVDQNIKKKVIITKIKTLNKFYKKYFKKKPLIAILGLNPHNSELSKSSKEKQIIIPAIKLLKKNRINIFGPFAADTILLKKNKFNIIVGMYHDQVLPVFKTIHGFNAINITLGLNYLRLSPDHGTAVNLIYKNQASTISLKKCIKLFNKLYA